MPYIRDIEDPDKKPAVIVVVLIAIVLLVYIALWVWALTLVIKHGHEMSQVAFIAALVFLFLPLPGGFLVSIILALTAHK